MDSTKWMVSDLRLFISIPLLTVLLFLPAAESQAQDAHYWDSQFGTRSQLLGGIVVGAPSDLSAVFYNPAWLAQENQPSVLLTTKTFEAYNLEFKNGFGKGTNPSSTKVTPSPGFFGAQFSHNEENDKLTIAFSYLQRIKFQFNAAGIRVDENPAPPPGEDLWFSGEAYYLSDVSEYWAGITFAKRIGDHTYLGITPFGALRNQTMRKQISAKGMDSDELFSHIYNMENADFWHTRFLVKAGLAFDYSPLTFGLTLTTPSIGLFGDGSAHQDNSLSGIDAFDPEGTPDSFLAVNYQPNLDPTFKSPLSLALGAAYKFGSTQLFFSAEWFNSMGTYDVLSPESYFAQSHPDYQLNYELSNSTRSIINWGIAASHDFSPRISVYTSLWIDKSYLNQTEKPDIMMAFWDLTHANIGASFEFMNIEFTSGLGFSHGGGTSEYSRSYNVAEGSELDGSFPPTEVTFNRVKFLIGFNLPFGNN